MTEYLIDVIALALLYVLVFFRRWKCRGRDVLLTHTLMFLYLSLVLCVTLMPVLTSLPYLFNHPYKPMNLIPFIDVLEERGDFIRQVVLNMIMTMPFGFLYPLTRSKGASFGRTVLCCFLMSLCIELLQPLLDGFRSSDITDLITNMLGGILGYICYLAFKPVTSRILGCLKT